MPRYISLVSMRRAKKAVVKKRVKFRQSRLEMDAKAPDEGCYRFGPFVLDPRKRELLRDGAPVALTYRLFETLLVFVRNPGRALSKDELLEAIWPGRYMEEGSLKQAIFALRKSLGGGDEAQFIVTAPGRGYSFAVPVYREPGNGPAAETGPLAGPVARFVAPVAAEPARPSRRWNRAAFVAAALVVAGAIALFLVQRSTYEHAPPVVHAAFNPPPRSVAVLAFTNMSGDPRQEYLADGLSEELTDALSRVDALRVASRTSAFFFKSHPATIADIARQLNVGAVLEGSIRREGQRLRITVQLINAVTGYHFWSRSYDRDFGDILKLQTEIADAITRSLQVTLQAGDAERLAMGGTNNSAAFDYFLRGLRLMRGRDEPSYRSALAAFDEAVRLDPQYARAHVMRTYMLMFLADSTARDTQLHALDAANRAVSLAPGWGLAHAAKGDVLLTMLDFANADRELSRARSLAPNDANVDRPYAYVESHLGHFAAAEAAAARVVERFPTDAWGYWDQAQVYYLARRYQDALAASRHASALALTGPAADQATSALIWLALGRADIAASICAPNKAWQETQCLAIAAYRLGKFAEAQARMAALRTAMGNAGAYGYAQIYAQWGARKEAVAWLKTAYGLHDTGLVALKVDPLMDPIRATPEFADIERHLNFPD